MTALRTLVLMAVGATLIGHASQAQIPRGPNVLAGRVVEITTEAPVAGAVVTITAPSPDIRAPQRPPLRNVMTAADGSFVIRDLPAGRYTITTTAFGYYRSDSASHGVDLPDNARPTLLTLRVWKFGSISGRVFDERGEPVVGVPVHALKRLSIGGVLLLRNDSTAAETDDRGIFQITNLPPSQYVVSVLASSISVPAALAERISAAPNASARFQVTSALLPGGARQAAGDGLRLDDFVLQRLGPSPVLSPDGRVMAFSNTMYPGTVDPAAATIVMLGSGESRTGIDIPLQFTPAVRVAGVLTGPSGPVRDVSVRLMSQSAADIDSYEPFGITSAVTDANGRFLFLAVPAGQYTLQASVVALAQKARSTRAGARHSTRWPATGPSPPMLRSSVFWAAGHLEVARRQRD